MGVAFLKSRPGLATVLGRAAVIQALKGVRLDPERFVAWKVLLGGGSIFEALVATVLTQNTSDANAGKALEALRREVGGITPRSILSLGEERLASIIRPAGMHRRRARQLMELAEAAVGVDLEGVRGMSVGEARRFLMSMPGVGPKTADVILVNLGKPAFPVDTHILRISRRLGLASTYDAASKAWMGIFKEDEYLWGHLSLIEFGRRVCRARNPKCGECGLRSYCNYYKERVAF